MDDSTTTVPLGSGFEIENTSDVALVVTVIGEHTGTRMQRVIQPGVSWHIDAVTEPLRITEDELH